VCQDVVDRPLKPVWQLAEQVREAAQDSVGGAGDHLLTPLVWFGTIPSPHRSVIQVDGKGKVESEVFSGGLDPGWDGQYQEQSSI